jgi:uncharacterized membrane protein YhaH (DUF805 family)
VTQLRAAGTGRSALAAWFVPTGRIRRRDWWLRYVLVIAVVGLLAGWVDDTFLPTAYPRLEGGDGPGLLWLFPGEGGPVTAVSALVLLVPHTAAMVTRFHDRDHSAWWLLWHLLPGIGWVVLLVTLGLLGSRPRPNRYGPPPA